MTTPGTQISGSSHLDREHLRLHTCFTHNMDIFSIVVTCCELAQKCVQIINEVQAWPEELRRITRRISRLEPLLHGLMSHLQNQPTPGLTGLQREQKNELERIMWETKECCKETHNILGECQSRKVGQTGLEFRESWLGDFSRSVYQKYGAMATALKKLEDNLEENYRDLNCYMGLLGIRQEWANHNALAAISERIRGLELEKERDSLKQDKARLMAQLVTLSVHLAPPTTAPRGGQVNDGSLGSYRSVSATVRQPTPEIRPIRADYKILFTDTFGDRSMVSEILVKILGAATRSKGGDWRVEKVRSAGFLMRENCDCVSEIEGLSPQHKLHSLSPSGGGWPPSYTGMMALYDAMKHLIPQDSKADIYNQVHYRKKSGLTRDMFRTYDFIIVFSWATHNQMLQVRNALVTASGQGILDRGKGRIVHLGQYLSSSGHTKDIAESVRTKEGRSIRENWDQKIVELQYAVQAFLTAELGWKQPQILK